MVGVTDAFFVLQMGMRRTRAWVPVVTSSLSSYVVWCGVAWWEGRSFSLSTHSLSLIFFSLLSSLMSITLSDTSLFLRGEERVALAVVVVVASAAVVAVVAAGSKPVIN